MSLKSHLKLLLKYIVESKFPSWQALSRVGESSVSKLTVIIPVIGYLIIFNENIAQYLTIKFPSLVNSNPFEFSPIYYTYFGLLLFSIATILFNITCPETISSSKDQFDFIEKEYSYISRSNYEKIDKKIKEKYKDAKVRIIDSRDDPYNRITDIDNHNNRDYWRGENSDKIMTLIKDYYDYENNSMWIIRGAISIIYFISFLLLALPTTRSALVIAKLVIGY